MSNEIYYDKAFIQADEFFVPLVNHGSSNCFEISCTGHEVPERYWSVLNYFHRGRVLFTREEIYEAAEKYEQISVDSGGGIRKSRYRPFEKGEFKKWILAGLKSAHTVEKYTDVGNDILVVNYGERNQKYPVKNNRELFDTLQSLKEQPDIGIVFRSNRNLFRPSTHAFLQFEAKMNAQGFFYALRLGNSYFVKRTRKRILVTPASVPNRAKKFLTEKDAQHYLNLCKHHFGNTAVYVECIRNGDEDE